MKMPVVSAAFLVSGLARIRARPSYPTLLRISRLESLAILGS